MEKSREAGFVNPADKCMFYMRCTFGINFVKSKVCKYLADIHGNKTCMWFYSACSCHSLPMITISACCLMILIAKLPQV